MAVRTLVLVLIAGATILAAQQPVPLDSVQARRDSLTRPPARLQEITVTAAPARREEPRGSVTVPPELIQQTPAVPYPEGEDQLRLTLKTAAATYMKTLGLYFPLVDADSAVRRLHWGETVLPLRLRAR